MSEERKEGVRQVWVSPARHVWTKEPTERERRVGPFHTAYLHDPPEGAPEPGERRKDYSGRVFVAQHVHQGYTGEWLVACSQEGRTDPCALVLSTWTALPLAPPKPKYRLAAVELTEEQVAAVQEWTRSITRFSDLVADETRIVASLLADRIEEIPE